MEKKVKVVVFSPDLSAVSGVSTHVNMLIHSALSRQFDFIHFQVGSEGRKEGRLKKVLRLVFSPLQLALLLLRKKPAIAHINTSLDNKAFWRDAAYLFVARLLGIKVINQIHGGELPHLFFKFPGFRWLLKRALKASNSVVVLTAEELNAYQQFDPHIHVTQIPNAIDAQHLLEQSPAPPSTHAPLKILYIGRLVKTKGLFEALEALSLLMESQTEFTFTIAGSGADEEALKQRVQALALTDRVAFLGPVFGEAKEQLALDADVFLFPTYNEGLPYALLEALAAGCVPIACPVGGIADVMQDGVHGLLIPSRRIQPITDALQRLSNDRKLLAAMAHHGRSRIKEYYTIDRLVIDFDKIYQGI